MPLPRTLEPEVMDTVEEATDYDRMDHSVVNQAFVDDLLTFLRKNVGKVAAGHRPNASRHFLDLGTGTAQIPVRLLHSAPGIGHITACDLSIEMLKLAQANINDARMADLIITLFCDAKQLPLPNHSVDVIMSNSIVHHIPEPGDVFREIRRCIRDGGSVFIRDLLRPDSGDEVEHLVATYCGNENAFQQQMFRQSLHAALTVDEVRQLAVDAGLQGADVRQTTDRHWTMSGLP